LQYVAGHDNIKGHDALHKTREFAVHKLFVRLWDLQRPEERIECKKILITGNLQSAEVVELADTPSNRVALEILYKLLIINLLPFASITSDRVPRHGQ